MKTFFKNLLAQIDFKFCIIKHKYALRFAQKEMAKRLDGRTPRKTQVFSNLAGEIIIVAEFDNGSGLWLNVKNFTVIDCATIPAFDYTNVLI